MDSEYVKIQKTHMYMKALVKSASHAVVLSLIVALLGAYLARDYASFFHLALWCGINMFLNGYRLYNLTKYKFIRIKDDDVQSWKLKYDLATIAVALTWGYFNFAIFESITDWGPEKILLSIIILGLVVSGITTNIGSKWGALAFPTVVLPAFLNTIIGNSGFAEYQFVTVFGLVAFTVIMFGTSMRLFKLFDENLNTIFEKQKLINEVQEKYAIQGQLEREKIKSMNSSKLASLGEMASGVAHEINNPLTIISGATWAIKKMLKEENYDRIEKRVLKIDETVERIAKIIKSMRSLSRNASSDPLTGVTIDEIIEDTLPICTQKFYMKNIRLDKCEVGPDLKVKCRPSEAGQVLINLLNNAIDELGEMEVQRWIKLKTLQEGNLIKLCVIDAGEGIDEKVREKIFEPFFTQKELGKGTGLGLSLSKEIMKGFGGDLSIDVEARNTTFVMTFQEYVEDEKKDGPNNQAA
jgi:signal transduction histidine kinase